MCWWAFVIVLWPLQGLFLLCQCYNKVCLIPIQVSLTLSPSNRHMSCKAGLHRFIKARFQQTVSYTLKYLAMTEVIGWRWQMMGASLYRDNTCCWCKWDKQSVSFWSQTVHWLSTFPLTAARPRSQSSAQHANRNEFPWLSVYWSSVLCRLIIPNNPTHQSGQPWIGSPPTRDSSQWLLTKQED